MKQGARIILGLFIVFLLCSSVIVADEATVNLESVVVQTFDNPDTDIWTTVGSKFSTEGYPKLTYAKTWPIALFGSNAQGKDYRSLGVFGKFDRKEFNWIDLIPVKKDSGGNLVPNPLPLPGRVKMVDMWVWGSNYDYYLECYVQDFKGVVHIIPMGDLSFQGWKNLRINIPDSIPQSQRYLPKREALDLVKFRLWTRPTEKVDGFQLYFDQIKVLTDTFETPFDGDALANQDFVNQIWSAQGGK
jgi:hypothetical protein